MRKHPRIWRARKTRPRPWFRCLRCGYRLFQVDIFEGHTAVKIGRAFSSEKEPVQVVCPNCGQKRKFYPCPVK